MYRSIFKTQLFEKLYEVDKDVDYIYNNSYKEFIEDVKHKKVTPQNINSYILKTVDISSDSLQSSDCVEANKINPIKICCAIFPIGDSFYSSINVKKRKHSIFITPDLSVIYAIVMNNYDLSKLDITTITKEYGLSSSARLFKNEMHYKVTEMGIKAIIFHELSHWLDDTSHGLFLSKRQLKAEEIRSNKLLSDEAKKKLINIIMSKNKPHEYMSDTEMNSTIHQINQVKRKHTNEEWDDLTLEDLFLKSNIYTLAIDIRQKAGLDNFYEWQKQLIKRMSRENILGRKMNKSIIFESLRDKLNSYDTLCVN